MLLCFSNTVETQQTDLLHLHQASDCFMYFSDSVIVIVVVVGVNSHMHPHTQNDCKHLLRFEKIT